MSDSRRKHLPPTPRAKRKRHKADARPDRRLDLRTTKQLRAADKRRLGKET